MDVLGNFNFGNLNVGAVSSTASLSMPSFTSLSPSVDLEKFLEDFMKDFNLQVKELNNKLALIIQDLKLGDIKIPDLENPQIHIPNMPDLTALAAQAQKMAAATPQIQQVQAQVQQSKPVEQPAPQDVLKEFGITQAEWNRMIANEVNGQIKVLGHGAYDQYRNRSGLPPGAPSLDTYKKTLFIEGTKFDDSYARAAMWAEYEQEIKTGKKATYDGSLGGVILGVREWSQ